MAPIKYENLSDLETRVGAERVTNGLEYLFRMANIGGWLEVMRGLGYGYFNDLDWPVRVKFPLPERGKGGPDSIEVAASGVFDYPGSLDIEKGVSGLAHLALPYFRKLDSVTPADLEAYGRVFEVEVMRDMHERSIYVGNERGKTGVYAEESIFTRRMSTVVGTLMVLPDAMRNKVMENGAVVFSDGRKFFPVVMMPGRLGNKQFTRYQKFNYLRKFQDDQIYALDWGWLNQAGLDYLRREVMDLLVGGDFNPVMVCSRSGI